MIIPKVTLRDPYSETGLGVIIYPHADTHACAAGRGLTTFSHSHTDSHVMLLWKVLLANSSDCIQPLANSYKPASQDPDAPPLEQPQFKGARLYE